MIRRFQCPSCGAANAVTNPGVVMKVCDHCRTAIYWDKESAVRAGNKSLDLPDSPRFKVGAVGTIKGRSFTVLGRLHYAHEKGTWDEWFIEMRDGEILWLAEDEGELFLEKPLKLTSSLPPLHDLKAGSHVTLKNKPSAIEEIGEARCLGGEGQIPFAVKIGETYAYADGSASDGSFVFGLEYDTESEVPTAFIGNVLGPEDIKAGPEAAPEPVARVGLAIRCASCGKPYDGKRVESTEMVVCGSCGAALKLDEAEVRVVGKNKGKEPLFTFKIGAPITLEKVRYEVMGRLYYMEYDEGIQYPSMEYVLYSAEQGYLWLSEEKGHFTISRPIHVSVDPGFVQAKKKVQVGPKTYRIYEGGSLTLRWVDGALPWTAKIGETTRYVHMIDPPEYVDQEITGKEIEVFRGRYVSRDEMLAAVPKGTRLPERPSGVYSCQPYRPSEWRKGLTAIGAAFLVLNILLLLYGLQAEKTSVLLKQSIAAEQYTQESLSNPFDVDRGGSVLRLTGFAPLNNSWLAFDFGLVDADDRVLKEFWNEASYYHGTDSEGPWTEGTRSFSSYFKVDKAGVYRLLIHGTGGSDYQRPSRKESLGLMVVAGVTRPGYFVWPICFSAFFAFLGLVARMAFEQKRWAAVTSGENGDDNGNGDDD